MVTRSILLGPPPPRTPAEVHDHVTRLPPWNPHLDIDPYRVKPISSFSEHITETAEPLGVRAEITGETLLITTDITLWTGQETIRLNALAFYLTNRDRHFDRDTHFGTPHPVAVPWRGGYRLLDGNHRTLSDRLSSLPTLVNLARLPGKEPS